MISLNKAAMPLTKTNVLNISKYFCPVPERDA